MHETDDAAIGARPSTAPPTVVPAPVAPPVEPSGVDAQAPAAPPPPAGAAWVVARERALEIARFLSVGGVAFVVDLGLFNLLRFGPGHLLEDKPITAKVLSVAAATLVSWLGNRHWTFASHATPSRGRELATFAAINVACAVIPVLTLAFSHYTLDLTSQAADNVSTVLGIAIGTVLRYVGYKKWVFTAPASGQPLAH